MGVTRVFDSLDEDILAQQKALKELGEKQVALEEELKLPNFVSILTKEKETLLKAISNLNSEINNLTKSKSAQVEEGVVQATKGIVQSLDTLGQEKIELENYLEKKIRKLDILDDTINNKQQIVDGLSKKAATIKEEFKEEWRKFNEQKEKANKLLNEKKTSIDTGTERLTAFHRELTEYQANLLATEKANKKENNIEIALIQCDKRELISAKESFENWRDKELKVLQRLKELTLQRNTSSSENEDRIRTRLEESSKTYKRAYKKLDEALAREKELERNWKHYARVKAKLDWENRDEII